MRRYCFFSILPSNSAVYKLGTAMRTKAILTSMTVCASSAWAATPVMDGSPMVGMVHVFTLIFMAVMIGKAVLTSNTFKGWIGELKVRQLAVKYLDPDTYRQLHDVTLPTTDGTTQIDHIIVSSFGIFVIETKHMSGWIFGRASDPKWTQSFRSHKNPFQNPLRQNYKHIKELNAILGIGKDKIFSVVVFTGDAKFKTDMPENVMPVRKLIRYIRSKDTALLSESDLKRILLKINETMLERSADTKRQHALNMSKKKRSNETDWQTGELIPKLKIAAIVLAALGALSWMNKATRPVIPQSETVPPVSVSTLPQPHIRPEWLKAKKVARSDGFGILTLSAKKDTFVTLYDAHNAVVVSLEILKGQTQEIEIKKGNYKAEILQTGKREVSTLSFIDDTGLLEL